MKKLLALFLAGLLLLSLCACASKQETRSNNIDTEDGAGESEEGAVTELHDETATEPPEKTETEAPEPPSFWSVGYYVDDWGDYTDDAYIRSEPFYGTFDNSATSGSGLAVILFYEPYEYGDDYFAFRLLEYGEYRASYSSYDYAVLKFKVDGKEYTIDSDKSDMFYSSDSGEVIIKYGYNHGQFVVNSDEARFISALAAGKEIKCIIMLSTNSWDVEFSTKRSKYQFTIPATAEGEFENLDNSIQ